MLGGGTIPKINSLVDAYNLASIDTEIALAAFDSQELAGELLMRSVARDEKFRGIGMEKPMGLTGVEVVVTDTEKLIVILDYALGNRLI